MSIDDEDDVSPEAVERRRAVRGLVEGLQIRVPGHLFEAVEASKRAFFVKAEDPDTWKLGSSLEADVVCQGKGAKVTLEVVRKEISPRKGVALRVAKIDPAEEKKLRDILGPLSSDRILVD